MHKNYPLRLAALIASLTLGISSAARADRIETFNFEIGPISIEFHSFDPDAACPNLLKDWDYPKDDKGNFYSPNKSEKLEVSADGKSITGKTTTQSAAELSSRGTLPELNDQSALMAHMLVQCEARFPAHDCSVNPANYLEAILPNEEGEKIFQAYCRKPEKNGDWMQSPLLSFSVSFECLCSRGIRETQSDFSEDPARQLDQSFEF